MAHLLIMGTPTPSITLTDTQADNGNHSYSGVSFGAPSAKRLMVVGVTASWAGSIPFNAITSCSIGGVSATRLARGFSSFTFSDLWTATVPTGTSGTVSFNGDWSNFFTLAFSTYAINYLRSPTPVDTKSYDAAGSTGNSHVTINVAANGVLVAVNGTAGPSSFGTPDFSGVTRDYLVKWENTIIGPPFWRAAHETGTFTATTAVTGRTVASTGVSGQYNGLAAASFR